MPLLVGAILKIVSLFKDYAKRKPVHHGMRYSLGTFTFYGLFFLAYGEFASFGLNMRFFEAEVSTYIGFIVGCLFTILMGVYVLLSHSYPKWFGSFKNRFYRF